MHTPTTTVDERGHFQQTATVSAVNVRQMSASARPLLTGALAGED